MTSKVQLALIAIIPSVLSAVLGYYQAVRSSDTNRARLELSEKRISLNQEDNPNYKEFVYPNYGMSLRVPTAWSMEDGPAVLAGGEFNLISRYEDTKGSIGINFRIRPIQPNYISDISAQIKNQLEVLKKIDSNATVQTTTISGQSATVFKYRQSTGNRFGLVRLYWLRLVPTVQLQVQSFNFEDANDIKEFESDVDNVIKSITVAFNYWNDRYNAMILLK